MPTASVNRTCGRASAPNSSIARTRSIPGGSGTVNAIATKVNAPITATARKADSQPNIPPNQVAAGTPTTLATERPIRTHATALACRPGPAIDAATRAATPK